MYVSVKTNHPDEVALVKNNEVSYDPDSNPSDDTGNKIHRCTIDDKIGFYYGIETSEETDI